MDKNLANAVDPKQNLEADLQAFADLNLNIDASGVILDYKPGYFLPADMPEIKPGQKIQDAFSPSMAEQFEQALSVTRKTGRINTFEYHLLVSGRVHWFDARLVPVSEARTIFTARDITECKETENRMKQKKL